ncbi:unnamed protein product [Protopolystoma xenopodis]|uniref:Uncharacterized protein n=1 Tax=Protopolystoma xenopodis TaxID=117903 RepID=A0A3S5AGH0_9PLAT|nr:unnamed protein product [Protopolystoma xenopodis]
MLAEWPLLKGQEELNKLHDPLRVSKSWRRRRFARTQRTTGRHVRKIHSLKDPSANVTHPAETRPGWTLRTPTQLTSAQSSNNRGGKSSPQRPTFMQTSRHPCSSL